MKERSGSDYAYRSFELVKSEVYCLLAREWARNTEIREAKESGCGCAMCIAVDIVTSVRRLIKRNASRSGPPVAHRPLESWSLEFPLEPMERYDRGLLTSERRSSHHKLDTAHLPRLTADSRYGCENLFTILSLKMPIFIFVRSESVGQILRDRFRGIEDIITQQPSTSGILPWRATDGLPHD